MSDYSKPIDTWDAAIIVRDSDLPSGQPLLTKEQQVQAAKVLAGRAVDLQLDKHEFKTVLRMVGIGERGAHD